MKKVSLSCFECNKKNYYYNKKDSERLNLKKFCKQCNAHTLHKEDK